MSTGQDTFVARQQVDSAPDEWKGQPLIRSIHELPLGRVDPRQAYVVSGTAMNEIIEGLDSLWALRSTLTAVIGSSNPTESA